jgi:P pilus assembly chaperone PapD
MEHVLFEDPPSSIRSFATSTSQLRNGDTGTLALFEDALPTDRGSVFEVWLTGIPISIDGSGTFQYDYTIELVVVPEPATGLMVGLGLAAMTLRRRT